MDFHLYVPVPDTIKARINHYMRGVPADPISPNRLHMSVLTWKHTSLEHLLDNFPAFELWLGPTYTTRSKIAIKVEESSSLRKMQQFLTEHLHQGEKYLDLPLHINIGKKYELTKISSSDFFKGFRLPVTELKLAPNYSVKDAQTIYLTTSRALVDLQKRPYL